MNNTGTVYRGLVIGYGNVQRQDDGVAWHVVNRLARLLGREPFPVGEIGLGLDDVGNYLDLVLAHQLTPEMAETLAQYQAVCFVDASVDTADAPQQWQPLQPDPSPEATTHQLDPPTLLVLAAKLYGQHPQAALLTIRGSRFAFGHDLSPDTAAQIEPAAWRILQWMREAGVGFTLAEGAC